MQNEEDDTAKEERTTNILDLNDDCLLKIFENLNIEALFNVAIANKCLRLAAVKVCKQKTRGRRIVLCQIEDFCPIDIAIKQNDTACSVFGLRTWLLYLRCFGSSISNLEISYWCYFSKSKWYKYVHRYVNAYCVHSLNDITFSHMPKVSINQFVRPFVNVHSVNFEFCELDENLPQFVECFPNLRHLRLSCMRLTDGFDRVYFPHLEQLVINGFDNIRLTLRNAANLLDSNRQLQSLDILLPNLSIKALLDMIKDHSSITKLTVSNFMQHIQVTSLEIQRIAIEHSLLTELSLKSILSFTATDVIALLDQLKSLKKFDCWIFNDSDVLRIESELNQKEWTLIDSYGNSNFKLKKLK